MPAPQITLHLTKFEQIEILRAEIEAREEELKNMDKAVREILYHNERQRFLQTIHPLFMQLPPHEGLATLPQLNAQRDALREAIDSMLGTLKLLESETAGQAAPPSRGLGQRPGMSQPPPAAPARKRFDF